MLPKTISQGDLLYHGVHGLCRVDEISKLNQAGKENLAYSLVPKKPVRMKVRFVIQAADMPVSGFHVLISFEDACKILEYLKASDLKAAVTPGHAGRLAADLLLNCRQNEMKDARKRQSLDRGIKELVRELALALKIPLKETVSLIRKNLGSTAAPLVLASLARAGEE